MNEGWTKSATVSVGGVVITYHPDEQIEARLSVIAQEVAALIVIDNSALESSRARLEAISKRVGFQFIANAENIGLTALNAGFLELQARGFEWAIAFDQDSTPKPGFGAALLTTATATEPGRPTAIVGANWIDEAHPERPARHLVAGPVPPMFERATAVKDLTDVTCVITSGTLFRLSAWKTLGGFSSSLLLDLVDTEYCLRARAAGYGIRVSSSARLLHRRGRKRAVRAVGRTWWPAFMPPTRLRYLFRNRVRVVYCHGLRAPHWVLFELIYAFKIVSEIVFFEDGKLTKLVACARGTFDGLLGRTGRIEGSSAAGGE